LRTGAFEPHRPAGEFLGGPMRWTWSIKHTAEFFQAVSCRAAGTYRIGPAIAFAVSSRDYLVTAPSDADDTSLAYFAITPVV
jgi:hypothetical protein